MDTPDDTAKEISRRLSKENIVLIIGHETSQTAKEINERLYEAPQFVRAGIPIPLILPEATNPNLTRTPSRGIHHILRLPANDDLQVQRLKDLVGSTGLCSRRIILIVNNSNMTYAEYIAKSLLLGSNAVPVIDSVGVGLGGQGFSPRRFLSAAPDTIIFIGMEAHATLMLGRMAEDNNGITNILNLVFTDGVAGRRFQSLARAVVADKLRGKVRVFYTGPFPTDVAKGGELDSVPTFNLYGRASRDLAVDLVQTAWFRGQPTGASILEIMQKRWINGRGGEFAGIRVRFDCNGDNVEGQEHVYEQGPRKALHSQFCSCKQ